MENTTVFIYALKCPDTLQVRYIGKAKNPQKRLQLHLIPSQRRSHTHKNHWLSSLLALGKKPILEILERTTEAEWQERERFYIQEYRQLSELTNTTDGGEGVLGIKQSAEAIAKRVASNTGKKRTPEMKALISALARERVRNGWVAPGKKINRFDENGKFIDSFPSASAMCRQLDWNRASVDAVLNSRRGRRSHQNFMLKRAEYDKNGKEKKPKCLPLNKERKPTKKVERLTLDGRLIDIFPSVNSICRSLGLHKTAVYRVLHGKRRKTAGFTFRYLP
jgi:group I intron endonuclease